MEEFEPVWQGCFWVLKIPTFEGSRFLGPETNTFAPENKISISHSIHVRYIYLHLP